MNEYFVYSNKINNMAMSDEIATEGARTYKMYTTTDESLLSERSLNLSICFEYK